MGNPRTIKAAKDLAHIMRNGLLVMDHMLEKGEIDDARHRCRGMMESLDELIRQLKERLENDTKTDRDQDKG